MTVISKIRNIVFDAKRPRYYRYAQEQIPCSCPLCRCPFQNGREFSFVYICEKRRLMYFDVPKCASSTIRKTLFEKNNAYSLVNPRYGLDHYFKFTFVRNPWSRMVSNWKMFTSQEFRIKQLKSMTIDDLSRFPDFVKFARQVPNHHWQPQVLFLPEKLDFVGHLETFDDDYQNLCEMAGLEAMLGEKHNTTQHRPYQDYYTPEVIDMVYEMYIKDIDMFGYKFPT